MTYLEVRSRYWWGLRLGEWCIAEGAVLDALEFA